MGTSTTKRQIHHWFANEFPAASQNTEFPNAPGSADGTPQWIPCDTQKMWEYVKIPFGKINHFWNIYCKLHYSTLIAHDCTSSLGPKSPSAMVVCHFQERTSEIKTINLLLISASVDSWTESRAPNNIIKLRIPSGKRLQKTMENHHCNGKIHYKWPFSIANC